MFDPYGAIDFTKVGQLTPPIAPLVSFAIGA